ncbi:carboxylate-amine ligase [Solirubrobacter soli]|uniref:carboxylate-amine ligase n=1 Tax=Solirubrobacter soli TaxID=363832 RepID=UPI00040FC0AA|nr:YbdK family carboxylate-amine ligase [Solirubrobacter soli]
MTEAELRAVFDAPEPLTIGLEEEVMLVDPVTLDLAPIAAELLDRGESGLKLELPASQAEIVTAPAQSVGTAIEELASGRRRLAALVGERARVLAAPVHPFAAPLGVLNEGERYEAILDEYHDVARAQLVCALQVHVAVGSADATLAVYNALRGYLPELAALAANGPYYAGRDTGYASVRPLIGTLLPRQGVPPAIASWAQFAEMLRWTGDPKTWWFEVRPHVGYGTLELRVCDTQATVAEAASIAAYVHALVAWLAARHDVLTVPERWRIEHNRFAAARHGLDATFADLETGERRPVRAILRERIATLAPVAERLGCVSELAALSLERNGAIRQREVGLAAVTGWLADRFLAGAAALGPAGRAEADHVVGAIAERPLP